MRLGFIGTGVITEAIVNGLIGTNLPIEAIAVSNRNAVIAARLYEASSRVSVCNDNQSIVDGSDIVVLAIRPQIAEAVVRSLQFVPGALVVSLVATLPVARVTEWTGGQTTVVRAVPLPFVAERRGVTALHPPHKRVDALFAALGDVIATATESEFDDFAIASAQMGTYFGILETAAGWLTERGMAPEPAQAYMTSLFYRLGQTAHEKRDLSLAELREGHSTPGGLNEQVFDVFRAEGGTQALRAGLDSIAERVAKARGA